MPDALDFSHYAVQDAPVVDRCREARLTLDHACAMLSRVHDTDRHGAALHCIGAAADHIEQAAAHSPAHRDALLPLATRLYEICDCIAAPYLGDVPGIEAAVRAVLAAMEGAASAAVLHVTATDALRVIGELPVRECEERENADGR